MQEANSMESRMSSYKNYYLSLLLIFLFITGIGVFFIVTPKYNDDYRYCYYLKDWFASQGFFGIDCGWGIFKAGIPIEAILKTCKDHFTHDNARIGNMIVPFFLILPKWVGSSIALIMWTLCMFCSFRLAKVRMNDILTVTVGVFLWSFMMAWSQSMGCLDYQFNYIIPSGLMMCLILYVTNTDGKGWNLVLAFLLAAVTGAWHEGFAIPVTAGSVALMISYKDFRKKKYIIVTLGLFAGILFLFLAPAASERMSRDVLRGLSRSLGLLRALVGHPAFLLFLLLLSVRSIIRKTLRIEPFVLFSLVSATVCIFLQIVTTGERRVGWWADLISITGIMYIIKDKLSVLNNRYRMPVSVAGASLIVIVALHWIVVDMYTIRSRRIFDGILAEHTEGKKTVFADFPTFYSLPAICMNTPDVGMFVSPYTLVYLNWYHHSGDKDKYLTVIPEVLREVNSTAGIPVAGNSGLRRSCGSLFAAGQCEYAEAMIMRVGMSNGSETDAVFICYPFVSAKDGKEYVYYYPWHGNWKMLMGKIETIYKGNNV